jgi:hypothetical protein
MKYSQIETQLTYVFHCTWSVNGIQQFSLTKKTLGLRRGAKVPTPYVPLLLLHPLGHRLGAIAMRTRAGLDL